MVQIVSAVALLAVLIVYSRRSIRVNGLRRGLVFLWVGFFLTLGVAGFLEWLVQRHGNWYQSCYFAMSLALLGIVFIDYRAYLSVCDVKKRRTR